MLALVRTHSGATCKDSLVVKVLKRYSKDPGSSPGGDTCFHFNKRTPMQVAPEGVLTKASIAKY